MTDFQSELGYLWSVMKSYSVEAAEEYLSI